MARTVDGTVYLECNVGHHLFICHLLESGNRRRARIVHDDIYLSPFVRHLPNERLYLRFIRNIGRDPYDLITGFGADLRGSLCKGLFGPRRDGNPRAFPRHRQRSRLAYSIAAPGNDGNLTFEIEIH